MLAGHSLPRSRTGSNGLSCGKCGSIIYRGHPLTWMSPLPGLQGTTIVAIFLHLLQGHLHCMAGNTDHSGSPPSTTPRHGLKLHSLANISPLFTWNPLSISGQKLSFFLFLYFNFLLLELHNLFDFYLVVRTMGLAIRSLKLDLGLGTYQLQDFG